MTTFFISRHQGAIEWAEQQHLNIDLFIQHIDSKIFTAGDTVIGTLPINIIYELQQSGIKVYSLILDLPRELRGQELSYKQLVECNARLIEYKVSI